MRYARAIAAWLAMSPASAMAGNEEPRISDEQMACVGAATKKYQTTNMQFVQKATANGKTLMSVDDVIAKRRLLESYCKQFAACLSSNVGDAPLRETVLRGTFAGCLSDEEREKRAR